MILIFLYTIVSPVVKIVFGTTRGLNKCLHNERLKEQKQRVARRNRDDKMEFFKVCSGTRIKAKNECKELSSSLIYKVLRFPSTCDRYVMQAKRGPQVY